MYKAHCQRVLEAVVAANFDDVSNRNLPKISKYKISILEQNFDT